MVEFRMAVQPVLHTRIDLVDLAHNQRLYSKVLHPGVAGNAADVPRI